jgi:hypothetical protein
MYQYLSINRAASFWISATILIGSPLTLSSCGTGPQEKVRPPKEEASTSDPSNKINRSDVDVWTPATPKIVYSHISGKTLTAESPLLCPSNANQSSCRWTWILSDSQYAIGKRNDAIVIEHPSRKLSYQNWGVYSADGFNLSFNFGKKIPLPQNGFSKFASMNSDFTKLRLSGPKGSLVMSIHDDLSVGESELSIATSQGYEKEDISGNRPFVTTWLARSLENVKVDLSSTPASSGQDGNEHMESRTPVSETSTIARVSAISQDGNITVVRCSKGDDIKIYSAGNGQCSDNYNFGKYGCDSVMRWAKERCANR